MRTVAERIEEALRPLIGKPLWAAHRGADMQVLHFGERRQTTNRRGEPVLVGEFGLHIQCTWRLVGPKGIVAARRDLYYPAGDDPYDGLDEFDYGGPVPNRRDVRLAALLEEHAAAPLVVESCAADDVGGFRLAFYGGYALEVFPDDSLDAEHWRLLRPSSEERHFVVTGGGIENGR